MSIVQYRQKEPRTCAQCGRAFLSYPTARYCSDRCRWQANNARRRQEKKERDLTRINKRV